MESKKGKLIERFLSEIKDEYPNLYVECNYNQEDDIYEIWHNNAELEYKNQEFKEAVGSKAQKILFDNELFNFYFGYDHFKALKLEKPIYTSNTNNSSFTMEFEINKEVDSSKNNNQYKLVRHRINPNINNDRADINLRMSHLDEEDGKREFTMHKSKIDKKVNWENEDINQDIREMGLAS